MATSKLSPLDFQFCECIGEGSYSKVYKGVSIRNRKTYAIKVLSKAHIQRENKRKYVNIEKNTLNLLGRHRGIVTLYYTFQDTKSLYFVIDFAKNGELLSLIRQLGSLNEPLTRYYMTQLVDALDFIHSKGIIHRDLKPENILLSHDWKLMITDFGAAKILSSDEKQRLLDGHGLCSESEGSTNEEVEQSDGLEDMDEPRCNGGATDGTGSFVGTAEYVSPELLKYNVCGFEGDLWALGCIAYQLIMGRPPFKGSSEYDTFERIVGLRYSFPANYFVPDTIKDFIQHLLVLEPEERYTIEDVKRHSWFRGVNWDDEDSIWARPAPKLEPYNPKRYEISSRLRHSPRKPTHLTPGALHSVPGYYMDLGGMDELPMSVPGGKIRRQKAPQKTGTQFASRAAPGVSNFPRAPMSAGIPSTPMSLGTPPGSLSTPSSPSIPAPPFVPPSPRVPLANGIKFHDKSKVTRNSLQFSDGDSEGDAVSSKQRKNRSPHTVTKPGIIREPKGSFKAPVQKPSPSISDMFQLPKASPDAISAAGAIGNLLSRRGITSSGNFSQQKPQLPPPRQRQPLPQQSPQQFINPILVSKQIPKDITNRLHKEEYILKLDNIFMSELSHKANQFVPAGDALNDVILNKIITENYQLLNKELKSCILIITSAARLFVYEISSEVGFPTHLSATQIQAKDFYSRVIEIKLTSRNVSMYDYEFDEDLKEGYLILELLNVNKLLFLSAYNPETLIRGSINSNVKVGFKVNQSTSWIDALLKAKQLLKKGKKSEKVVAAQYQYYQKVKKVSGGEPKSGSARGLIDGVRNMRLQEGSSSKDAIAAAGAVTRTAGL
ncbi:DEKNAAC101178 [Brettanomyces naardenensis]|uniref:non-specific serine/threonine protein kinase n=1 Tax=Brettanomyces naardenensis TaxID=13370 RepID=A0A448YH09_BRENA|nr:DEKNAAC101178 [Brettanomyces naardenensis]